MVSAYGLILPQPILDAPGAWLHNVHASILPRWAELLQFRGQSGLETKDRRHYHADGSRPGYGADMERVDWIDIDQSLQVNFRLSWLKMARPPCSGS